MKKINTGNNIITTKTVIIGIVSLIITYFFRNETKNGKKKHNKIKRFKKTFKYLLGILTTLGLNHDEKEITEENDRIKIEYATIIDI